MSSYIAKLPIRWPLTTSGTRIIRTSTSVPSFRRRFDSARTVSPFCARLPNLPGSSGWLGVANSGSMSFPTTSVSEYPKRRSKAGLHILIRRFVSKMTVASGLFSRRACRYGACSRSKLELLTSSLRLADRPSEPRDDFDPTDGFLVRGELGFRLGRGVVRLLDISVRSPQRSSR